MRTHIVREQNNSSSSFDLNDTSCHVESVPIPFLHQVVRIKTINIQRPPFVIEYDERYDTTRYASLTREMKPYRNVTDLFLVKGLENTSDRIVAMPLSKPEILVSLPTNCEVELAEYQNESE